ncbi:MAG: hypothetical protein A2Y10_05170 [Planctomycetes bacterium GWF2_41_51]|nr:MAG: hypothetical protein A2Y10_05170 [Planctomycetes bacterium GWF2_41_51]
MNSPATGAGKSWKCIFFISPCTGQGANKRDFFMTPGTVREVGNDFYFTPPCTGQGAKDGKFV